MRILINAGPTREKIDPVRFISNHSTGKMGYALAAAAVQAGHQVTLVSGPSALPVPEGLFRFERIESAAEMAQAMKQAFPEADLTILCAAVADYRPVHPADQKIKKQGGSLVLELERTEDIALSLGKMKASGQLLCGFAAETENLDVNAKKKLAAKNFDWIAANRVGCPGSGFGADTNIITLYAADGRKIELGSGLKTELAREILKLVTECSASDSVNRQ